MKTEALTLRLSADLAKDLRKLSKRKGVPKSQVVREAVAVYLSPSGAESPVRQITASALALAWKTIPRLTPDEASEFERDIAAGSEELTLPQTAWE